MWLICTFVVNSGLSFLLGLAVAGVLGPEEYGRFAVASLVAIVLGTVLFDWLRLSATRFYDARARREEPELRAGLDLGYRAALLLLAAVVLAVLALGIDLRLTAATVIAVAAAAATNGGFEYSAALARALFLNRAYARLVLLKNGLAFVSMVAAGLIFGSAASVLGTLALSTLAASLSVRGTLQDPRPSTGEAKAAPPGAARARLLVFARYGWPIVGANLAYQGIVLVNRVVATSLFGYAAGGQLSLATDITIRLFLSAGAALDVFLFQLAVRRGASDGMVAAHRQVARNMVLVTAALGLLAVTYVAAMPAFEALFVPGRFHGDFGRVSVILVPGVLAFCLVQFALSPVFQVAGRTSPVLWTALVALAVDAALLAFVDATSSLATLAWLHTAGLLAGFLFACRQAFKVKECRPAPRDLAGLALAAAATALAIWPLRDVRPAWLALAGAAGVGAPLYLAVLLAFDVGDLRRLVRLAATPLARVMPGRIAPARARG